MSLLYEELVGMGFAEDISKQASEKFSELSQALDWIESVEKGSGQMGGEKGDVTGTDQREDDDIYDNTGIVSDLSPEEEEELKNYKLKESFSGAKTVGNDLPPPVTKMTTEQLQQMIMERKRQNLENSRRQAAEEELKRRQELKEIQQAREENEDRSKQLQREKEKREREREVEKKRLLLKQIEMEKEMRRKNNGRLVGKGISLDEVLSSERSAKASSATEKPFEVIPVDRSNCSIRVRQTNGKVLPPFTLPSDSTVNDIYDYIDKHRTDGGYRYTLVGGVPRRNYPRNTVGTLGSLRMAPGISLIMSL